MLKMSNAVIKASLREYGVIISLNINTELLPTKANPSCQVKGITHKEKQSSLVCDVTVFVVKLHHSLTEQNFQ